MTSGGDLVGESVGTQEVAVALHGDDLPDVHLDLGADAEGPGEDVAFGVDGRFGLRQRPLGHQLLGHRVVHAQLVEDPAVEAVGPGVTHVDQHQTVAVGGGDQGGGRDGGAHAPQGLVIGPPAIRIVVEAAT